MEIWLILAAGVVCAGIGGDLFERGLVRLAGWLRIPAGIIGVTVAAFATSSPELSVSISSALAGTPQIALGDALGSNVVNFGLVLGIVAAIWSLSAARDAIKRDFRIAILAPPATLLLAADGQLSRWDGAILLAAFAVWLGVTIRAARAGRPPKEEDHGSWDMAKVVVLTVLGLAILIIAGRLVVISAQGIGEKFGLHPFFVGGTMVAVGTSVPELVTAIFSRMRNRGEVGLGTVLGSNLFNGLFIVGIAASIHPIRIPWSSLAVGIGFGVLTIAVAWPGKGETIRKWQGVLLLIAYAAYVLAMARFR